MSVIKKKRASPIIWNESDYVILLPAFAKYVKEHDSIPNRSDVVAFTTIISSLPMERRKAAWTSTNWYLSMAFSEYQKGGSMAECIFAGKQKHSIKTDPKALMKQQMAVLPEVEKKPVTRDARKFLEKQVNQEKVQKKLEEVPSEKETIPVTTLVPEVTIVPTEVKSFDGLPELFDLKLKPLSDMLQKLLGEQVVENTTMAAETITEAAVIHPVPPVDHYQPKDGDESKKHMFTVAEIRAIIREEIELIFGAIPAPVSSVETVSIKTTTASVAKKTAGRSISKVTEKETVVAPVITLPVKKYTIYIYGLDSVQMSSIRKNMPDRVTIEGATTFSHSIKDKAKNCDLVILSKFVKHSVEKSLISVCGKEKVEFISGGMTMIMRRISDFILQNDKV